MPTKPPTGSRSIKDFKVLPDEELVKMSLDRLDAYYSQLDQWEKTKAETEKKRRDQARLRVVARKRQEEKQLAREKEKAQTSTKEPKLVFSCVEVKTISRPPEKAVGTRQDERNSPTSSRSPRSGAFLPQWKNDGKPLPYFVERELGVAYPATTHSPKIFYLKGSNSSSTPQQVSADKHRARRHPNNEVHSYTVAKDGYLYHKSASWQPSRDRCMLCVKNNLHCWRRVVPKRGSSCLRCTYRRVKCDSVATEDSDTSDEEELSDHPPPKTTQTTKRRKDDKEEDEDEEDPSRRLQKRQKISQPGPSQEDYFSMTLRLFEDVVKESARHHAALENLVRDTMASIHSQNKEVNKRSSRE